MIGIVHGYGLGGSGSNLWTREAVSALCNIGETVHLMCQESSPERYDFVSELVVYDENGQPETRFRRETGRPGACTVHRPALNVLPTYVRPDRPSHYVRSILDLDHETLEEYLERNARTLARIRHDHDVRAWHVNHTILLSEALRRRKERDGTRFAVMPHGSALEYVVQHDDRMKDVARRVLDAADAVFALNQEVRDRLARYFPDLDLDPRTVTVRVGVDTDRFRPVPPAQRRHAVEALAQALDGVARGRFPDHARALPELVDQATDPAAFRARLEAEFAYPPAPDADLEGRLARVPWHDGATLAFVGRLIPAKGVSALVTAFPLILERHPDARLLLVGTGWLREYLEAFLLALRQGDGHRAATLLRWTATDRQEGARPFATTFLDHLQATGHYEAYVDLARRLLRPDNVLFTGFLEHHLLAHVFPLADIAIFPSAVAEASPLVIPEAAACGCLPMGTDFAGMRHSLDSLDPHLPRELRPLTRLRPDPRHTVQDIIDNVDRALTSPARAADTLRRAAVEEYDWRTIARSLANHLHTLADSLARRPYAL
jgi:glycosyltransferase involved in cell wall biosynthesis